MSKYINSSDKLDLPLLTADLQEMFEAVVRKQKEFKVGAPLPALVRAAYLEAFGSTLEKTFQGH